jgi:endonuclease/exonuclease/phosphatase family metal-dependent hydrolase
MNGEGNYLRAVRWLLTVFLVLVVSLGAWAQELRIASYNMERLGENKKDYAALVKVISSFDVVAAEEVMNAGGMSEVLGRLGQGWSDTMSESGEGSARYQEFFGFFYDAKVQLVSKLGEYPKIHEFFRPPYGARFKSRDSALTFNLFACHIMYGRSDVERVAEIGHLGVVYRYFEGITGNRGVTIILGDFNEDRSSAFQSLAALDDQEAIPQESTTIGTRGPAHAYDHVFLPPALRPLETSAGVDYWTTDYSRTRKQVSDHFPVYIVLKTGKTE